jgi:cyclohexa-1,5-dienecarbonyl-CoA hydratase
MIKTFREGKGAWLRIALSAPPGNVLSLSMVHELRRAIGEARGRRGLKWLTIESTSKDFSFGASIPEHLPHIMPRVLPETHQLLRDLLNFPCPTAALVEGKCLGGGFELVLSCDDIIAAADAAFGFPEIRLCAFPPAAAALLPLRVGTSRAARAMTTGEPRPAQYWHDAGLISIVAARVPVIEGARDWFDRYLAPRSAVALAHVAEASRLTLRAIAEPALESAERQYVSRLLKTADAAEGIQAWIDKRPPAWKDA